MASTIYTKALTQAAQIEGSSQALATLLHVPENTLLRWMAGRAQMPLRAFLTVIDHITKNEMQGAPATPLPPAGGGKLQFPMGGGVLARCSRCSSTDFAPSLPTMPLQMASAVRCRSCGAEVAHGKLLAQFKRTAKRR